MAPQSAYPDPIGELLPTVNVPGDDLPNLNAWAPEGAQRLPVRL